ncbi:MAG: hypothetical protein ACR2GY_04230 [Phycisphaerales bacterium]
MKHGAFRFFLLLILGGITTVGVAWGLATFRVWPLGGHDIERVETYNGYFVSVGRWDRFGLTSAWVSKETGATEPDLKKSIEEIAPSWCAATVRARVLEPIGTAGFVYNIFDAYGLPAAAMSYEHEREFTVATALRTTRLAHGLELKNRTRPAPAGGGILIQPDPIIPLRPIFPGFIINTLFYALIWFGALAACGFAKRTLRTRRGRCIECNYDLRGDFDAGCPECGWGRSMLQSPPHSDAQGPSAHLRARR